MRFSLVATPQQRAAVLTAAGCAIVFSATPELSGTYALDDITLAQIGSVARDAAAGLGLPFGQDVFYYPDLSRSMRPFTSDQIQSLYKVLRDYTAGLAYFAAVQAPDPPAQPVTIES